MLEIGADSAQRHAGIGRLVAELGLGGLVTVGPGAVPIADGAREAGTGVRVFSADGVDEAVALVQQNVRGGDVVLIKASRAIGLERVAAGLLAETDETERPSAAIPGSASPAQSAIPEPDAPAGPTERKEEPA
jgi:UDP-N-acetylmuramoyl-tripeptide--D-alanyl-D-alanine ligase